MLIINNQEDMDNLDINSIQNVDEIKISNVSIIPEGKFCSLRKLIKVNMDDVNIIKPGAFMNCENLETINIINKPDEIRDFAFHNTKVGFVPELYENTIFGVYNNLGKNIKLENLSWSEIDKLSKLGKSSDYFNISDMKSMTLTNGEIYNAEIIGFNHDDLANGSGKAGITFQFKELMTTKHNMNSVQTNVGGWEASEMRSYVNNDVFALLPTELQAEIKTVNKISDAGNKDTSTLIHTSDKLFLLSTDEVGLLNSYNVTGQGTQYEKFTDNASCVKYLSDSTALWWLRSTYTSHSKYFFHVQYDGRTDIDIAIATLGVTPAFCI